MKRGTLYKRPFLLTLSMLLIASSTVLGGQSIQPAVAAEPEVLAVIPDSGPVTVAPCVGTTSDADGNINTPGGFTLPEGSWAEQQLRQGKTVMLYGNQGDRYINAAGASISGGVGGLPYCGVRVLETGELESGWRFCTDEGLYGCANRPPGSEWTGTPKDELTEQQKLQISYVLMNEVLDTKRDRAKTQTQVWCISESFQEGSVASSPKSYFNSYDFNGSVSDSNPEYAKLSDNEVRCDYRPELNATPELEVSGPSGTITGGTPAQFTLTTNITTPIDVAVTGAPSVQLCPAQQAGATFDGTVLQLQQAGTVTLCATASGTSTITLTADSRELPQVASINLLWNGDVGCQVFADFVQGDRIQLTRTANADVKGNGAFEVRKIFDGVQLTPSQLNAITVQVQYEVVDPAELPEGYSPSGTLPLTAVNQFHATGPSYPEGTQIRLSEERVSGLPNSVQQGAVAWTVNGAVVNDPILTVGSGEVAEAVVTNTLEPNLGTFEVRKLFRLDDGSAPDLSDTDYTVRVNWEVERDPTTNGSVLLNSANGFSALPGDGPNNPVLFPIGTTILLEEEGVTPDLPDGVTATVDWGASAVPGKPSQGRVTISEVWDQNNHTPGGTTSAAEVTLTNGLSLAEGSLRIKKSLVGAELGEGSFAETEVAVEASWVYQPDGAESPLIQGSNTLILNEGNGWESGLGVELPVGTQVSLTEESVTSTDPSIEWTGKSWSCSNCTPPIAQQTGDMLTVVIPEQGEPIDLAVEIANSFRVMTGSFEVMKIVEGDIDTDDPRLADITFTASWEAGDQSGELQLRAPSWTAVPEVDGEAVQFPLGTQVRLSEVKTPEIPGIEWTGVRWSPGGDGKGGAEFTIQNEQTGSTPSATLRLINTAELREGTFSIAKEVHSINELDTASSQFTVNYRSVNTDPEIQGSLNVQDGGTVQAGPFPEGTELVLEEIVPDRLPNTIGWEDPVFIIDGKPVDPPVTIVISDGTDVRVTLVNKTIEPDFTLEKISDPEPGVSVLPGESITYTVIGSNTGETVLDPVTITDDFAGLSEHTTLNKDSLKASIDGRDVADGLELDLTSASFTWTGALAVGETVEITYSVIVNANVRGETLVNTVKGEAIPPAPAEPITPTPPPIIHPVPVPDFAISKSADPASGETVLPGEKITYTITGTNTGQTLLDPVVIEDNVQGLSEHVVFDEDSLSAAKGSIDVSDGLALDKDAWLLTWTGALEVGESVDITYEVTVKANVQGVLLENVVSGSAMPPGPPETTEPLIPEPPATEHPVPKTGFELLKSSDPASGSPVISGDVITYTVTGVNTGETALDPVVITDDLSGLWEFGIFDEESMTAVTGENDVSDGIRLDEDAHWFTWTGSLDVGESVVIEYKVTVKPGVEGNILKNVVNGSALPPGPPETTEPLVPEPPTTEHPVPTPGFSILKSSNPKPGTPVVPGDRITYTVSGVNTGETKLDPVTVTDDLSGLSQHTTLDENSFTARIDDRDVSDGLEYDATQNTLTWTGSLEQEESVVINYSVTVNQGVQGVVLKNVVNGSAMPPGPPETTEPITPPPPSTEHPVPTPGFESTKTSDPKGGTIVRPGGTITYTLTGTNTGGMVLDPVHLEDDLSGVLEYAEYQDDAKAMIGERDVSAGLKYNRGSARLTWEGVLQPGETVVVTFSVKVTGDAPTGTLKNRLTSFAKPPGIDPLTPPDREVVHKVIAKPSANLSDTGSDFAPIGIIGLGALLTLVGAISVVIARKRKSGE